MRARTPFPWLVLLTGAGCSFGPKYQSPAPPAPAAVYKESPEQFKEAEGWKVASPQDAKLRGKWWEIFHDSELNALEDQLAIDNQTIRQSFQNFLQARSIIREVRSRYFPTIGAGPAITSSRSPARGTTGSTTTTGVSSQNNSFSFPFDISWEPDLWGRIRKTVEQARYAAQLSAADLENVRLTEQANLAQIFFEIRGQDELRKILDQTVENYGKSLELARARYETGIDTEISVVQAQAALDAARASALNNGIARAQFEHALAVLTGKVASNFSMPVKPLTATPPPIPVGLPSELLERRPDIAAAERAMAAANAQIGIATVAFYPSVSLTGSAGFNSSALQHLFSWPARFWSVGAALSQTIFDAGLRRATVNQFIAAYNADVAAYRQTVLTGFQQVEDELAAVRIHAQEIGQRVEAVHSSETYLKLQLGRYETGVDPYLDVIIAQNTLLANQLSLTNARVSQMTAAVQLIKALGGGWDRSQLPSPSDVSRKLDPSETQIQK